MTFQRLPEWGIPKPAKWGLKRLRLRGLPGGTPRFWFIVTTPPYHEGRGPYISIGLGLFAIYRGY